MSNLIARLVEAGVPPDIIADVAEEIARLKAELQVLERRRKSERERKAAWRERASRHVTERDMTPCPVKSRTPSPDKERSPPTPPSKEINPFVSSLRSETKPRARECWPVDYRDRFWARYPHKVGKTDALKKLDGVMRSGRVDFATLMAGLDRYIASKPPDRAWCNPATWINQGRWEDEPAQATPPPQKTDRWGNPVADMDRVLQLAIEKQARIDAERGAA